MKKIFCLDIYNDNSTIGKWYDVYDEDASGYCYHGDNRSGFALKSRKYFITLQEYRRLKLERLENEVRSSVVLG